MLIYSISLIIMSVLLFGIFDYGKEEYEALSVYNTNLLKGIAAILIVISHIGNKYGIRYFTPLGGIGVSVFLMLSGYGLLLSYKKKGLNNFLARRFSGILIPYWIVVIIYSFINIDIFNIYDFIMQILLIKTIPYTWFVQYIIILYIAFYVIFKIFPENYRIKIFIFLSTIIIFLNNGIVAEQAYSFIIGIIIANHKKEILMINRSKLFIQGIILCLLGVSTLIVKQIIPDNSFYLIFNFIDFVLKESIALGIVLMSFIFIKYNIFKGFSMVGKVSYEVYLMHTLLIFIISNNFNFTNILIYVVLTIAGVSILHVLSKKTVKLIQI